MDESDSVAQERSELAALDLAQGAMGNAHAPYSGFAVGAALVLKDGATFRGCNVESASYGLTLCAERSALAGAIAARGSLLPGDVLLVAIATEAEDPTPPCGACRQWLAEHAPGAMLVSRAGASGKVQRWTVAALLPDAFTGAALDGFSGRSSPD